MLVLSVDGGRTFVTWGTAPGSSRKNYYSILCSLVSEYTQNLKNKQ